MKRLIGNRKFALALGFIICTGAVLTAWMAHHVETQMRQETLARARLVAQSINPERLRTLTASTADTERPDYVRLKDQLARARQTTRECRFLYLMGRNDDGVVFFYVDSLAPDNGDYTAPGTIYDEVSRDYLRVFDSGEAAAVGPVTDRWGTFITALVPIQAPETGEQLAVLGMDTDAGDWHWIVAAQCALPVGLTLALVAALTVAAGLAIARTDLSQSRAEVQETADALRHHVGLERLISEVSSDFVRLGAEDMDAGIDRALATLGAFIDVDRAYVFLCRNGTACVDNTHEWCREGVEPQLERLQSIHLNQDLPWFAERIQRLETVHVPDVAALPEEASLERAHFEQQGIQSLIAVPIVSGETLSGFLGFDDVRASRSWSEDARTALRLVGETISNALARKKAEEAIHESEERLRLALEASNTGLWDWDLRTNEAHFSPTYYTMLGYEPGEFPATYWSWREQIHPEDRERAEKIIQAHVARGEPFEYEFRMETKSGEWIWILSKARTFVTDERGRSVRLIGTHADITQQKETERLLEYAASYDALTGLLNRRYFEAQLEAALHAARRHKHPLALCMGDLDTFKNVNDTYGHAAGDAVLTKIGELIRESCRADDFAGRFGGDEFCFCFPHATAHESLQATERLRHRLNAFEFSTEDGRVFHVGATFGLADFDANGMNKEALFSAADQALYQAKAAGRNRSACLQIAPPA